MAAASSSSYQQQGFQRSGTVASFDSTRSANYTSTKDELRKNGVPDDYAAAILDDDYMERLIKATDALTGQRREAMSRYVVLQKALLAFFILQSALGVIIALYKTVLQPSYTVDMQVHLEDVDMVLMLDASNHMADTMSQQHLAVQKYASFLNTSMEEKRAEAMKDAIAAVKEAKAGGRTWFQRLFGLDKEEEDDDDIEDSIYARGGYLRIATALFNSHQTWNLHGLTNHLRKQEDSLKRVTSAEYRAHAQWFSAMEECEKVVDRTKQEDSKRCREAKRPHEKECEEFFSDELCPKRYCAWSTEASACKRKRPLCRKQFCVIIGDSDALCKKRHDDSLLWQQKVEHVCNSVPSGLCPKEEKRRQFGNPLEWTKEMADCSVKARSMLFRDAKKTKPGEEEEKEEDDIQKLNERHDIKTMMMFTVPTYSEKQMRLGNRGFKEFVESLGDCRIDRRPVTKQTGNGVTIYDEYYARGAGNSECLQFIMETGLDALMAKAKETAKLLNTEVELTQNPNPDKDYRYLLFMLLALNLVFYFGWTKLMRYLHNEKIRVQRIMGVKKKMVKVTKTVVEKVRLSQRELLPCVAELEMAERVGLKVPVEFGPQLQLRARLKGGYLRWNEPQGVADGHGHASDHKSAWVFEPVDDTGGSLEVGQQFRIRNAQGQYLAVDESGTRFQDVGAPGLSEFAAELVQEQDCAQAAELESCNLGDTIRIRSAATGKCLRVHKDGHCDGLGEDKHYETQFVVDLGGPPITSGSIVTLRSDFTTAYLHGSPLGDVRIGGGKSHNYNEEDWRYWVIERMGGSRGRAMTAMPSEGSAAGRQGRFLSADPSDAASFGNRQARSDSSFIEASALKAALHEGDVVTLRGLNQHCLEVEESGSLSCGRRFLAPDAASAPPSTEVVGEFVVHRIGVSRATQHNSTVRRGAQISLKPVRDGVGGSRSDDYVCVTEDEEIEAAGRITDREIVFTIDIASIGNVVQPLTGALHRGDAEVLFTPLWNKNEVKRVDALSAAWTSDESLNGITGAVVVAADSGSYAVPHGKGGWVAIINDGVDLFRAAKQAKAQGATGLIVRCEEACSMDRLALGTDGADAPVLPTVFVNEADAESLKERGLVLKGCDIRKRYMTDVMRALGRAGAPGTRGPEAVEDVFNATGHAMMQRFREYDAWKEAEEEKQAMEEARAEEETDDGQNKFQWKVNANTHYYWARSGGGASKMQVNYGKKAPPSAHKEDKLDAKTKKRRSVDAGYGRQSVRRESLEQGRVTRTRVTVTTVPAEYFQDRRLPADICDALVDMTEEEAREQCEELSEESDFRIEYKFETVEVGVEEKPEDLDEEEYMNDEGAVIAAIGVPKAKFWMVASGLLIFTLLLLLILILLFNGRKEDYFEKEAPPKEFSVDGQILRETVPAAAAQSGHFLLSSLGAAPGTS